MTRTVAPAGKRTCRNRHWFAYYGRVGSSARVCRRCGAPNPDYRPDDDPHPGGTRLDAAMGWHPTVRPPEESETP
jgi:hypothetical protein